METLTTAQADTLPLDVLTLIALNLPLENIASLCRTSHRFSQICRRGDFWMNKLRLDYPDVDISGLSLDQLRREYERNYAGKLWQTGRQEATIKSNIDYDNDPEFQDIEREIADIRSQRKKFTPGMREWQRLSDRLSILTQSKEKRRQQLEEYDIRQRGLNKQRRATKMFPRTFTDWRYLIRELPEKTLRDLQTRHKKNMPYETRFIERYFPLLGGLIDDLLPGTLIELIPSEADSTVPHVFVYATKELDSDRVRYVVGNPFGIVGKDKRIPYLFLEEVEQAANEAGLSINDFFASRGIPFEV